MQESNPLSILLAHDHWASRQVLDACATITPEQFHRRFEMGPGSLHDTMLHILGAMRTWTESLAGKEPGPRVEQSGQRSVAQLLELMDACAKDLRTEADRLPLSDTISRVRDGKTFTFARGVVLTHVATHGMHHRAQCLNMLRHVGVTPLPPTSVTIWSQVADN